MVIMKTKLVLILSLILSAGATSCSTSTKQQRAELTWPAVAVGQWAWTPRIVDERFSHASKSALGSNKDMAEINQVIAADNPHQKLRITELRWLSPTLAMARVSGTNVKFDYIVQKEEGRWQVVVHYTRRIID
jgi:hypothetical protein